MRKMDNINVLSEGRGKGRARARRCELYSSVLRFRRLWVSLPADNLCEKDTRPSPVFPGFVFLHESCSVGAGIGKGSEAEMLTLPLAGQGAITSGFSI